MFCLLGLKKDNFAHRSAQNCLKRRILRKRFRFQAPRLKGCFETGELCPADIHTFGGADAAAAGYQPVLAFIVNVFSVRVRALAVNHNSIKMLC